MSYLDFSNLGDDPASPQALANALDSRYANGLSGPYQRALAGALTSRSLLSANGPTSDFTSAATLSDTSDKQAPMFGVTDSPMRGQLDPTLSNALGNGFADPQVPATFQRDPTDPLLGDLYGPNVQTVAVTPAIRESIGAIPGYPEQGKQAWRAANDLVIQRAANDYNLNNNYEQGLDPRYVSPELMKAWEMEESGGSPELMRTDPFHVNAPGDWVPEKARVTGLRKHEPMTPDTSAAGALKWLQYKGQMDRMGPLVPYAGNYGALLRYNGNWNKIDPNGLAHPLNYVDQIWSNYDDLAGAQSP